MVVQLAALAPHILRTAGSVAPLVPGALKKIGEIAKKTVPSLPRLVKRGVNLGKTIVNDPTVRNITNDIYNRNKANLRYYDQNDTYYRNIPHDQNDTYYRNIPHDQNDDDTYYRDIPHDQKDAYMYGQGPLPSTKTKTKRLKKRKNRYLSRPRSTRSTIFK